MSVEETTFEHWALLEIMGHNRFAGLISEQTIAGGSFIRIDIPESDGLQPVTKFFNASSVYCITPVSEEVARGLARKFCHAPINSWEIPEEMRQPRIEQDEIF